MQGIDDGFRNARPFILSQMPSILWIQYIYLWRIVASIERTCICDHFKDHATKCPEINTLSMALPLDDFRCHVVRCATHGKGAAVVDALGKSHVNQLWVPILTNQCVFRFQVTVCNSFAVHVLQSANHQN